MSKAVHWIHDLITRLFRSPEQVPRPLNRKDRRARASIARKQATRLEAIAINRKRNWTGRKYRKIES